MNKLGSGLGDIPNISSWLKCKFRTVGFWLTQALTGQGVFGTYTKRIGKTPTDDCRYCDYIPIRLSEMCRGEEATTDKMELRNWYRKFYGVMLRSKYS